MLFPLISHPDPGSTWRAQASELLIDRVVTIKRMVRSGKEVLSQNSKVRIALVEQVYYPGKYLEALGNAISSIQIDDGVPRNPAIDVLVIFVTAGEHTAAVDQMSAD